MNLPTKLCLLTSCLAASVLAQGIPGVMAPSAKVQLVQEGFTFTEGPVGTADGGLYFSDIMGASKTYRMTPDGKISVYRENTNNTNGLALMKDGSLIGAEGDGKRIRKATGSSGVETVTEGIAGMALMAPNDLIVDAKGGIYFTDPGPRPVVPGRKVYVYYLPAGAKQPKIVDDSIARPNGLTITIDGKRLIVDDTVGDVVSLFDIQRDGTLKNKRPFCMMRDVKPGTESGADGLAIDRAGRLFITSGTGVQVFNPKGEYLGTIQVPRQPANVAFSGPGKKTLYITARQGLYKLDTLTQGPARLGK